MEQHKRYSTAYVGEEDTGDAASCVQSFLVTFLPVITTCQASLMACYTVLMSFNATRFTVTIASQFDKLMGQVKDRALSLPPQGQIGGRNHLDKVHEIVGLLVCLVLGIVKRVDVVVGPSHALLAYLGNNVVRQLRTEAKMVNLMGEGVFNVIGASPVVLKIVNVHVAVAERFARSEVEVANDLVDTDSTFDTTALSTLLIEMLRVVLACTLLNVLASSKRPRDARVSVANFGTGVAAASFLCVRRGWCAITFSTVVGVQVGSRVIAMTDRCQHNVSEGGIGQ
jgi:hypothetical protein